MANTDFQTLKNEAKVTQAKSMEYISNGYLQLNYSKNCNHFDKISILKLYIDSSIPIDIRKKYLVNIISRQRRIIEYLNKYYILSGSAFYDKSMQHISKGVYGSEWEIFSEYVNNTVNNDYLFDYCSKDVYIDAGFDLFVPSTVSLDKGTTVKIDTKIKAAMYHNGIPISYYMYPRSSTGAKTPLRLANSVGIIDAGYRGNCMAIFDVKKDYTVNEGDRLVQFCSGNLNMPIFPYLVNTVEELGSTNRGSGGFGSTGR